MFKNWQIERAKWFCRRHDFAKAGAIVDRLLERFPGVAALEVFRADLFLFERKFWSKDPVEFRGNKVFQRDDLIDLKLVDKETGLTNLQLMSKGRAPIGPDGMPINLHHMTQKHDGAIAEVTQTFIKRTVEPFI